MFKCHYDEDKDKYNQYKKIKNMDNRKFNFGKYKGHEIYSIIIDHTGYILWLFENTHFKLNKVEQELFDAVAKATMADTAVYVYPKEHLAKFIQNKESDTPFHIRNGVFLIKSEYDNNDGNILVEIARREMNKWYDSDINKVDSLDCISRIVGKTLDSIGDDDWEYMHESDLM